MLVSAAQQSESVIPGVRLSCPTLSDPVDCSPPRSSVHGILQARILELGCHFLFQRIFPTKRLNPCLLQNPTLTGRFFTIAPPGKPSNQPYISVYPLHLLFSKDELQQVYFSTDGALFFHCLLERTILQGTPPTALTFLHLPSLYPFYLNQKLNHLGLKRKYLDFFFFIPGLFMKFLSLLFFFQGHITLISLTFPNCSF